jgi:hypothetical protein
VTAWWEDPETALKVMRIFSRYRHHWIRSGSAQMLEALCCGFRASKKDVSIDDGAQVTCPGCKKKRLDVRGVYIGGGIP